MAVGICIIIRSFPVADAATPLLQVSSVLGVRYCHLGIQNTQKPCRQEFVSMGERFGREGRAAQPWNNHACRSGQDHQRSQDQASRKRRGRQRFPLFPALRLRFGLISQSMLPNPASLQRHPHDDERLLACRRAIASRGYCSVALACCEEGGHVAG